MTGLRVITVAATAMSAAMLVAGCDSADSNGSTTPSPQASPSPAPTALVKSSISVQLRPSSKPLSGTHKQVVTAFNSYITAWFRFYSHPWIIDPVLAKSVLPSAPGDPLDTDTIGEIGPVVVQILSVTTASSVKATVAYCVDDRSVRYMGRDGAVDVPGPAGDRLRGGVSLQTSDFAFTTEAAADGTTTASPRWLVASGGFSANDKACQAMIDSPPPPAPSPRGPTTTP